ncbi:MAG: DUF1611 domain-containing protein [Steroidobacteraceae bacterium]
MARAVGVSLNTSGMSEQDAAAAIAAMEDQTGLPCSDPIRCGIERIVDHVRGLWPQ